MLYIVGIIILILLVGGFIIFLKVKITYRPWINVVASTTFGIYLLHDNKLFLHYMWDNVLALFSRRMEIMCFIL